MTRYKLTTAALILALCLAPAAAFADDGQDAGTFDLVEWFSAIWSDLWDGDAQRNGEPPEPPGGDDEALAVIEPNG
ncbi:MAG: hypothetical protein AAGD06_32065 [Acidobacteriota bacterium]